MDYLKEWNNFLNELEDEPKNKFRSSGYKQRKYKSFWVMKISKKIGGDKLETEAEIRSIPNVTTVSKEKDIFENEEWAKGLFKVSFVLEGNEDQQWFLKSVLYPELKKIQGLTIEKYKGMEQIGVK